MRKRTSKPRVVWLPPNQDNGLLGESGFVNGGSLKGIGLTVSGDVRNDAAEAALTIDTPRDPATESLSDLESSGYRLRRIVGRVWIAGDRIDEDSGIEDIYVGIGAMVRRCDSTGTSLAAISDQATLTKDMQSMFAIDNKSDPWIFSHMFKIQNPGFTLDTTSNAARPSSPIMVDHTIHIDQKTARIVGPEERLFFHACATGLGGSDQSVLTNLTTVSWDLRVLATMKTSTGNRRNATR